MSILGLPTLNPYPLFAGAAVFAMGLLGRFKASVSAAFGILTALGIYAYIKWVAPRLSAVELPPMEWSP